MKRKVLVLPLIALLIFVACKQGYSSADNSDKQKVEAGVEISQENFPDDVFREYVSSEFDANDDCTLSDEEILDAKEIFIDAHDKEKNYSELKNVQGIQYLSELEDCRIFYCPIDEIDLSRNIKLSKLILKSLKLNSLDISRNVQLDYLTCNTSAVRIPTYPH